MKLTGSGVNSKGLLSLTDQPSAVLFDTTDTADYQNRKRRFFASIRNKMIFSLVVIYILGSLTAVMALFSLSFTNQRTALIESFYELNQKILEIRRYEKNYLLYGNINDLLSALDFLDDAQSSLELFKQNNSIPETVSRQLPGSVEQLKVYTTMLRNLPRYDDHTGAKQDYYEKIRQQGHLITRSILLMDNEARMALEKNANQTTTIALILLASTMALGALLSVLFARWVIEPLGFIRKAVNGIMLGKLSEIPMTTRMEQFSECRDMVYSLNKLLQALKIKQEQLVQSTKLAAIGEVTAGIAHEINNPLNNIFLTAEVFLSDIDEISTDEQTEYLQDILDQANRAREVVRHLLDFSKVHKPSKWEQCNVIKLLDQSLVLLKNQIALNHTAVVKQYADSSIPVIGHSNLLQQVFVNIILNAIQSMGMNGELTLTIKEEPSTVTVMIKDNGPGIPEEVQKHIFDPFYTTKDVGTGLGLSVCYAIVKEHHGEIQLESREGEGAVFEIILPSITQFETISEPKNDS